MLLMEHFFCKAIQSLLRIDHEKKCMLRSSSIALRMIQIIVKKINNHWWRKREIL